MLNVSLLSWFLCHEFIEDDTDDVTDSDGDEQEGIICLFMVLGLG